MQLKTKVKVGNITNLSDARYCAGMGVDFLGFPIGDMDGQIPFDMFSEIVGWVSGPAFVLEYSDTLDEAVFQKVTGPNAIHHIELDLGQLHQLGEKAQGLPIILKANMAAWPTIEPLLPTYDIRYLALGENQLVDWKTVDAINKKVNVLVPYHLIEGDEIEKLPITGIILEGSSEDKPGQKDYGQLATALEALEAN